MSKQLVSEKNRFVYTESIQRLLNAYLREMKMSDFTTSSFDERGFLIDLKKTKMQLMGTFTYYSLMGHHEYGDYFQISGQDGKWRKIEPVLELAEFIVDELTSNLSENKQLEFKNDLLKEIKNSAEKTIFFLENKGTIAFPRTEWNQQEIEQSLLLGHPFHPTPKSSEGFSKQDLLEYAPECGVEFPLHYWLIRKDWIEEEWILEDNREKKWFSDVLSTIDPILQDHYSVLPLHPWQARFLLTQERVLSWLKEKNIIDIGQVGPAYYPTSSVRTVANRAQPFHLKLPLHVKITHFVRENNSEQVKRSIDASRIVNYVRQNWEKPHFSIFIEQGSRTINEKISSDLNSSLTVLFRENNISDNKEPLVIASLLESNSSKKEPPIIQLIRQAGKQNNMNYTSDLLEMWFDQYINISFIPILSLWIEKGISLEAHVQNSLLHVENGWPNHFYVRDMEGVSISKEKAEEQGWINHIIPKESPVLYNKEEAWNRLLYYVLTNHCSHLISVLSRYSAVEEKRLWRRLGTRLVQAFPKGALDQLFDRETFPAKANLLSRLQRRGEDPIYVTVNNPLNRGGEKNDH